MEEKDEVVVMEQSGGGQDATPARATAASGEEATPQGSDIHAGHSIRGNHNKLIEHSTIFGLHTTSFGSTNIDRGTYMNTVLTGKLLHRIPEPEQSKEKLPPGLEFFVFPNGIRLSSRMIPTRFHSFVLTMLDGSPMYAFCIIMSSPIDNQLLGIIKMQQAVVMMQTNTEQTLPKIVYEPKALCIISKYPFHKRFRGVLEEFLTICATNGGANEDNNRLLYEMLNVAAPLPGQCINVSVGNTIFDFSIPLPEKVPLMDLDHRVLFQMLEPKHIITVVNALMCEISVVMTSCKAHVLTPCLETIISLLYPMKWPYIYITLMPSSLNDIFEVPQPFFIGTLTETLSEPPWPTCAVVVDLDNNCLTIPPDLPFQRIPWQLSWRIFHNISEHFNIFHFEHPGLPLNPPENLPSNALMKSPGTHHPLNRIKSLGLAPLIGVTRLIMKTRRGNHKKKKGMTLKTMSVLYSGLEESSSEGGDGDDSDDESDSKAQLDSPGPNSPNHRPYSARVCSPSSSASSLNLASAPTTMSDDEGNWVRVDRISSIQPLQSFSESSSPKSPPVSLIGEDRDETSENEDKSGNTTDDDMKGPEDEAEEDEPMEAPNWDVSDITLISQEQLDMILIQLYQSVERTVKKSMFGTWSDCFTGRNAITFMIQNKICRSVEASVALGNRLMAKREFVSVNEETEFKDENSLYRFLHPVYNLPVRFLRLTCEQVGNMTKGDLAYVAQLLLKNLDISDRMYVLKKYKSCFVGSEAVKWMVKARLAANVDAAVAIGMSLVRSGYIDHVNMDHTFKNEYLFYRFSQYSKKRLTIETKIGRSGSHKKLNGYDSPRLSSKIKDSRQTLKCKLFNNDVIIQMSDDTVKLKKAFLSMYVTLFSSYRSYVHVPENIASLDIDVDHHSTISFFDEETFEKDLKEDYKGFVSQFVRSQMFHMFVEERVMYVQEPDWFEMRCLDALKKKVSSNNKNRSENMYGLLYKLGSRIPTWQPRYFELDKLQLKYYNPKKDLLNSLRDLENLTRLYEDAEETEDKSSLIDDITELRENIMMMKKEYKKGTISLVEGCTSCDLSNGGWSEPTQFPFVINIFKDSSMTKLYRQLECCAYTADDRREWMKKISARVTPVSVPFSSIEVDEMVRERLQQAHVLRYKDQNQAVEQATQNAMAKFLLYSRKLFDLDE